MSEFNQSRRTGIVTFGSDFGTATEVVRLFDRTAERPAGHPSFQMPVGADAVCMVMSENGGCGWRNVPYRGARTDGRGHCQIVRVDSVNDDFGAPAAWLRYALGNPRMPHYLFWREQRDGVAWYKFHGVFTIDLGATDASLAAGVNACVYAKVADECPCTKADWRAAEVSPAAFAGYAGRTVEAVLLDRLACRGAEAGSFRAWPGQKLLVAGVSPDGETAVCAAPAGVGPSDRKVELAIPRRDFELGYFRFCP